MEWFGSTGMSRIAMSFSRTCSRKKGEKPSQKRRNQAPSSRAAIVDPKNAVVGMPRVGPDISRYWNGFRREEKVGHHPGN